MIGLVGESNDNNDARHPTSSEPVGGRGRPERGLCGPLGHGDGHAQPCLPPGIGDEA